MKRPRPGGVHDVAAPQGVDAEDGVGDVLVEALTHASLLVPGPGDSGRGAAQGWMESASGPTRARDAGWWSGQSSARAGPAAARGAPRPGQTNAPGPHHGFGRVA